MTHDNEDDLDSRDLDDEEGIPRLTRDQIGALLQEWASLEVFGSAEIRRFQRQYGTGLSQLAAIIKPFHPRLIGEPPRGFEVTDVIVDRAYAAYTENRDQADAKVTASLLETKNRMVQGPGLAGYIGMAFGALIALSIFGWIMYALYATAIEATRPETDAEQIDRMMEEGQRDVCRKWGKRVEGC